MNDEEIDKMVSHLVEELDYDIWKSLFDEDCIEDEDLASETRECLRDIVKDHLLGYV